MDDATAKIEAWTKFKHSLAKEYERMLIEHKRIDTELRKCTAKMLQTQGFIDELKEEQQKNE